MDLSTPVAGGSGVLRHLADIPLPGDTSRFDYQSFDSTTGQLYISHMDAGQLVVFDTKSQAVTGTVDDLPAVTGVLVVPELHRIFAAVAGDHQVAVIDTRDLRVIARLGTIGFPDGLAYAPQTRQVFVSDESGGGEVVIDAVTNQVVTTIDIGGEAGNTHYDAGSGCIVIAVQSSNQLVVIDPTTDRQAGRLSVDSECQGPHGFLIDAPHRLAFVTCEDNATLLVVELTTMQVTASLATGDRPDVLAFDPGLNRLYVASEAGVVSIFAARDGTLDPVGDYRAPHAHSVAVDPATHLVYLPLEDIDGQPVLRILAPYDALLHKETALGGRFFDLVALWDTLACSRFLVHQSTLRRLRVSRNDRRRSSPCAGRRRPCTGHACRRRVQPAGEAGEDRIFAHVTGAEAGPLAVSVDASLFAQPRPLSLNRSCSKPLAGIRGLMGTMMR
jgi:DNA-binding beta-propeller fold protein YncE